jgi:ornithine cyclodeaminase/alanine dehydrogenase-like protein (mu-crystallin family)
LAAEAAGQVVMPPRLDVDLERGFLRVMPAAFDDVMGLKVMTLVRGLGNRYLILLYDQSSGALIAALDADEITRLRTAATTTLVGELLCPGGCALIGLIGSGFEAEGHVRALAHQWPLQKVLCFSPNEGRRRAFAARMSTELGIEVVPVASMPEAISTPTVSVLATKSADPVVDGSRFPADAVVLSIGSTRPDLRELDAATMKRAAVLVADDPRQVRLESADIIEALERRDLCSHRIVPISAAGDGLPMEADGRDLKVFKSVGTAVQDLALSSVVFEAARDAGRGRDLGELVRLKAFPTTYPQATDGAAPAGPIVAEGAA